MGDPNQVKIILHERKGEEKEVQYVRLHGEKKIIQVNDLDSRKNRGKFREIKELLSSIFLPQGYPSSVSEDYLEYQIWDTVQAFASSLSGSLSTRAVLEGVGVGSSSSTPLAATLMWLIKDGTGMVGRILFAWLNGAQLDADSKKWRFFADVLNDCAMMLELCAPYALASIGGSTRAMTAILCVAGTAKSIVGVAGGATRAALTQHQARQGNLADVSAKDGSQETLVNLAALVTSLWLLPLLDGSTQLTWLAFMLFTILHIVANYRAVKAVKMRTLNRTRFLIVLQHFFKSREAPSVEETNRAEPVVMGRIPTEREVCGCSIRLGESVQSVVNEASDTEDLLAPFSRTDYALIPSNVSKTIYILLKPNCPAEAVLEAYSRAALASMEAQNNRSLNEAILENQWKNLGPALTQKGWTLDSSLLGLGEWRATW